MPHGSSCSVLPGIAWGLIFELTYTDNIGQLQMGYGDNNNLNWFMRFVFENVTSYPKDIQVSADQLGSFSAIPNENFENNFTQYATTNDRVDAYRIFANEKISSVTADVYFPALTELITFTPSDDDKNGIVITDNLNAIQLYFGADHVINWNNLNAQDFILKDNEDQSEITIIGVQPEMDIDWSLEPETKTDSTSSLIIRTAVNLVKGHTYSLATSSKSEENEIMMPSAGKYNFALWLGRFATTNYSGSLPFNYEYVSKQNAHFFDQVTIKSTSSDSEGSGHNSGVTHSPVIPNSPNLGELNTLPVRKDIGGVPTDSFTPDKKDVDQAIQELPADNPKLTVHAKMDGDAVQVVLPADSLSQASSNKSDLVVSFDFGDQSYELPVSALNLKDIASGLQADLADVTLKVMVVKQTGDAAQNIQQTAESTGSKLLSDALEFTVVAEANGKQTNVNEFGNTYVSRSISLNQEVDKSKLTGVTFDPVKKEFRFVPAIVTVKDGKTVVTLKRTGNSIYAVIESNKSFTDIATHWAKNDIQLLASKLIVQGVNETEFAPERTMTRAEYTALLVRSLGLTPIVEGTATFEDVAAEDWYYGEVEAAVKAGITNGDGSGEFHPDDQLTREQAAVLTAAALKFAGQSEQSKLSATIFKDSDQISNWALHDVNQLQSLQILSGMPNGNFEPQKTLTRAEAVTILKRFLLSAELMN